jgi:hypothetical protein
LSARTKIRRLRSSPYAANPGGYGAPLSASARSSQAQTIPARPAQLPASPRTNPSAAASAPGAAGATSWSGWLARRAERVLNPPPPCGEGARG